MSRKFPQSRQLGAVAAPLALAFLLTAGLLPVRSARAFQEEPTPAVESGKSVPQGGTVAARAAGNTTDDNTDGFSADQLSSYAEAVRAVQGVDRAWSGRIDWADTVEQAEDFTQRAAEEMAAAIQAQGLSLRDYNSITRAVAEDQRLYDRVTGLLTGKGDLTTVEAPAGDRRAFFSERTAPSSGQIPPSSGLTVLTSGL